jgi:hypothetical protein
MLKNKSGFDLYKERGDQSGLYAEPTNVLSNIAFFAAAMICWPFAKSWADGILVAGCILVGLGSTMYHSRPCRFTQLWDVVAIVTWVMFYLFCWGHFMMGLNVTWSVGVMAGFAVSAYAFLRKYGRFLNGSADYIPVILLLLICGSLVWYRLGHPHMVVAGLLAAIALVFRVVDNDVKIQSGTHFLWHILNGFLMAMLTMFMSVSILKDVV